MEVKWKCYAVFEIQSRGKSFAIGELVCSFLIILISLIKNLQLSDVMSGVTYLHDLGIVHGDIKGVRSTSLTHLPFIDR